MLLPDWIEGVFHTDPDQHSGVVEWAIACSLLAATVVFSLRARREWRRPLLRVEAARPAR
jgi:hypothetical protein